MQIESDNLNHLRQMIAQQAARMMAEEGISDFAYAKKKASKQLRVNDNALLPSNAEIEHELRLYNALFLSDEQPKHLAILQQDALATMQFLEKFNPHLTGAVLDGTAGFGTETHIHLFADSLKEVEMFLLNQKIPFETNEKTYRILNDGKRDKKGLDRKKVPVFSLETASSLIKISIFEVDDIRISTKHVADGRNAPRANIETVKQLLTKNTNNQLI